MKIKTDALQEKTCRASVFFCYGSPEEIEKLSIEDKTQNDRHHKFETEIVVSITDKSITGKFTFVFDDLCFPDPSDQNAQ